MQCLETEPGSFELSMEPVHPFQSEELCQSVEFMAGDRPFVGLSVPDACLVRLECCVVPYLIPG